MVDEPLYVTQICFWRGVYELNDALAGYGELLSDLANVDLSAVQFERIGDCKRFDVNDPGLQAEGLQRVLTALDVLVLARDRSRGVRFGPGRGPGTSGVSGPDDGYAAGSL